MRSLRAKFLALLCGLTPMLGCKSKEDPPPPPPADLLQVPSPDWRDQIIYFVMTDRFANGDPGNDDQGAGEYNPQDEARYSGGDLQGLLSQLDYIQGLGATTVWLTPPVANQWWDPLVNYGGYHGYWARNFTQMDAHLGTLEDYQRLSRALHGRGMYLVQDIVLNHMANCFRYVAYEPDHVDRHVVLNTGAKPACGPSQAPFDQWDPTNAAHRQAGIFHWTPAIVDYQNPEQEMNWQLADLDDLNTSHPAVMTALKDSYSFWLREAGVDGFRVDTVFYVSPDLFKDFLFSKDPAHPGVLEVARSLGKDRFLAFGEGFASDKPFEDTLSRKVASYMDDPVTGEALLPGMLQFPLYRTAGDVFARGNPTSELAHRLMNSREVFSRPHLMPTFLDNHDVDRFRAGGSEAALRQALVFMMTVPGIPVLYYGTEQGFTGRRSAMFKAGFESGGRDRFDTSSPLYAFIRELTALRKAHAVFRRGVPTVLRQNEVRGGVFAYKMEEGGEAALVLFNTSDEETLLDNLDTGLPEGQSLTLLASLGAGAGDVSVGSRGRLSMKLPARGVRVFRPSGEVTPVPPESARITLSNTSGGTVSQDFELSGTAVGVSSLKVVVDGALGSASEVTVGQDGSWRTLVSVASMVDPNVQHSLVAWSEGAQVLSETLTFRVSRTFVPLVTHEDPANDDTGPEGRYHYPSDVSWGSNHQGDFRRVTLLGSGNVLKLAFQMPRITTEWNPQNGFDHVAFTVFIDVPGRTGLTVMPQQNRSVPAGMDWDYRIRAHGWSNALFETRDASATNEGSPVSPAAALEVDAASGTVFFTLPGALFAGRSDLSGVKVYATTWDYDGGYRPLVPGTEQWKFGGGEGATDPLVLDDTPVLTIP
ncbi:alpha-amylase family glycosyl hydrolase [Stigmatella sp. ncwal1]|uniref:Alpha-amylase family glycosyl hydrolase n=1 Tax=Stigmatella ashevillensis TaxID=2995309 RepID=A0ABT5DEU1_9BACT|nr:alpha-amylase family glycosyl hydrolase [Stigmatella ashevillena]MDC0711318.1 alpha-amylase family glycosyl hydrolase [Stigmatella ashevillena]